MSLTPQRADEKPHSLEARLKVIQVVDSLRVGGAEALVASLSEAAADPELDLGLDLEVVVLSPETDSAVRSRIEDAGIRIAWLPPNTAGGLMDVRRVIKLREHLRKSDAQVVHAHLGYSTIAASAAARLAGVPLVVTLHNTTDSFRRFRRVKLALETIALRSPGTRVIAVGHSVGDAHGRRLGRNRATILTNPSRITRPPHDSQRRQRRQMLVGDDATEGPVLVTVGRLSQQKGHEDLLEAIEQLGCDGLPTTLLIVGAGDQEANLRRRAATIADGASIRFLGQRNDVPEILTAADVFVSASHWEGTPLAVLEAMGAGLPVVATEVGDVPRVVPPGAGVLVPPARPDLLAGAIAQVLRCPGDMGRTGQEHVARAHRPEEWAAAHSKLYRGLAAPKNTRRPWQLGACGKRGTG